MARSWVSIVKGKEVAPLPVKAAEKPKPKPKPQPLCVDCGANAMVCRYCRKAPVFEGDECVICLVMNTPSEEMCGGWMNAARRSDKIPYKCKPCHKAKPWRWTDGTEIVSYIYERSCFCHRLSPTNVIRSPVYRRIEGKPTDSEQREEEAMAAYKYEMKFSGDEVEAFDIYRSFFPGVPPPTLEELAAKAKA
jgi:hypothetical protein